MRSHTIGAVFGVVVAALAPTGCGHDLFSHMNGTRKADSASPTATDPHPPSVDSPTNHGDNSAARRPGTMARKDQQTATARTREIKAALETQQQCGQIFPKHLLPVLEDIADPGASKSATAPRARPPWGAQPWDKGVRGRGGPGSTHRPRLGLAKGLQGGLGGATGESGDLDRRAGAGRRRCRGPARAASISRFWR